MTTLANLFSTAGDPTIAVPLAEGTVIATLFGQTQGSTITLDNTFGGMFKIVGNQIQAGARCMRAGLYNVTGTEVLAGAAGSPARWGLTIRTTSTLAPLTVTNMPNPASTLMGARVGDIIGKTPGTSLSILQGDGSLDLYGDDLNGWNLIRGPNTPSARSMPLVLVEQGTGIIPAYRLSSLQVANTFVHLGDSRVQGMYLDGSKRNKGTNNQWNWANRMSGNRMVVVGNFGVAGQTSIQQLAYLEQALATGAGNLSLQAGVNDFTANIRTGTPAYPGDQLDTTWGAIWYMCERARALGMRIWLWLDPGSGNQNAAQIALRDALNANIRIYAQDNPVSVVLCDLPTWGLVSLAYPVVWKTDADGNVISTDTTHLTTVGGKFIGTFLAALVQANIPAAVVAPFNTPAFVAGSGSLILTPNPMFQTLTGGGSVGSGNSGTLPGSVSGSRIGGSSAAFSNTPNADGFGNDLIMTVTNTSSVTNDRARCAMNLNTAAMTGGYWLETGCEIDVAPGARGIMSVTLGTNFSVNGVQNFNNDAISDATRLGDRGNYTGIQLKTDPLFISGPTSATPSFFITAYAFPGEDGTATINIRKPWARLRTVGGYPV